ncbi:MAG TPA: hypothetical protein VKG45_12005 [Actinomycetes bacterium]|nr:hypothetical protein [Actinomycetes bacterium]
MAGTVVPGLGIDAREAPDEDALRAALHGSDLVVVENACSLPLHPAAGTAIARALRGRRAILHHHDLPWQRPHLGPRPGWPPDDPAWLHVTINELSRLELAERGIHAITVYNSFDTGAPPGRRDHARRLLGIAGHERLLLQPTRAIRRKNIPAGVALANALGAAYWLTGPAEDGYGQELARALAGCRQRVIQGIGGLDMRDAYAAADAVAFGSTWEGFGNPLIEAAIHRRPLAVGRYPVLNEIARLGFRWFGTDDPGPLRRWLDHPDQGLLEHNRRLADRHFSIRTLPRRLASIMEDAGWLDLLARAGTTAAGVAAAVREPRAALGREVVV